MDKEKWAVIGGGIMGMTLADKLSLDERNITIYEGGADLGGLVSTWKLGDVEWDKFYHVILLSDFRTRSLLKDLGFENEIQWVETKTGFFINGELHSMSDTFEFLKFPALHLIDKFRLGITILYASKIRNWKSLEKIPVVTWLKKWSGKKTFEKIWMPLLKAKLGDSYQQASAVFIWATIQRLYGARRSGLKKEMFGYLPGGYKRIVESFKQKLIHKEVVIKTNHLAVKVLTLPNGKPGIAFEDGKIEEFDKVILTLPSSVCANICQNLSETETQKLNDLVYLGVICVAIILDKSISPYYITNITDTWIPFTGVIEMSALVDQKHLDGNSLVYLPKYVSPSDELFKKSDLEIQSYFIDVLKKMYPFLSEDNFKFVGVARAKHVMTIQTLNYSDKLPNIKTSIPGVYIVNSAHITEGTLNVNETIKIADAKLIEIFEDSNQMNEKR
jgi:protoporphyrinogen oxidase